MHRYCRSPWYCRTDMSNYNCVDPASRIVDFIMAMDPARQTFEANDATGPPRAAIDGP